MAAQKGIGRLTSFTDASGGMAYVYDHRGNVVQETRTIGATSYVTAYAYDLADNLTQVTYPSGRIVSYARDSLGRVSGVTTKANALAAPVTVASNVTWMPFGPLKGLTYGNGLDLALSYDQDYRLTSLTTAAGATTIQSLSYGYDNVGNITSITDSVNASRSQTYGYDNLYRLTSATGVYGTFGYSYDAVGNRLTRTRSGGAGALSETYSYAANSNRLLSVANGSTTRSFSYTAAGNISLDDRGPGQDYGLVYSNDNRLAELTQASQSKATYANSDAGERVRKTLPGSPATTTHYLYDQGGNLIDEDDSTGTAQREYIRLAGLPLALISGGQLAFVHMDHLGTPQAMTDEDKVQVWDIAQRPFGAAEIQTGPLLNPQRFPGQLADDEAGYHDNVWRTYDPSIGRYVQSDPIGLEGGLNTFAYVDGNPVMLVDPTGERSQYALIFAVAGIVAAVAERVGSCDELTLPDIFAIIASATPGGRAAGLAKAALAAKNAAKGAKAAKPLLGHNPRAAGSRTNTDLPGDRATAKSIFRNQSKGQDIKQSPMENGGTRRMAGDGTQIRMNPDGTTRLDLPGRGPLPKGETVHIPPQP